MTPSEWYKSTENNYINKRYVMFGLGNGEYVSEVLNNCKTEVKIIVFEPKASGVGQKDEDYVGLKELSSACVEVYVEGKDEDSFTNFLYKNIDYSSLQGMIVFKHPSYVRNDNNIDLKKAEELFDESINAAASGINATRYVKERFGAESYENMIQNYFKLAKSKSFSSLIENIDKDVPAIIVASGPSLGKNMHFLNKAKGKSFIISADSAVSALLANDIYPDIYISVDPHKEAKSFEDDRIKNIASIIEVTSSPNAIKEGQYNYFLFNNGNNYLEDFINSENIDMHLIGTGGSVANTCFDAAITLGFKTIIFVGLDLAYTGNKTHVENTARYGMTIDESTAIYVKDINGEMVKSSEEFVIYKTLIEDEIRANADVTVIDATEGGAFVNGTMIMRFEEAVDKYCIKEFNAANTIEKSDELFAPEQAKKFEEYVLRIPDRIKELASDLRKSLNNYDEMYMMVQRRQLNKGRLTKILADNDKLSERINVSPVLPYIEYLSQDAIHVVEENAYKHNNDIFDELKEAASIGRTYSEGMLKGTKRALEIIDEKWNCNR